MLSDWYSNKFVLYAVPELYPLLQTFLTISVYSTIAISVQGLVLVYRTRRDISNSNGEVPNDNNEDNTDMDQDHKQDQESRAENDQGNNGQWKRCLSSSWFLIGSILLFGVLFNTSRWLEITAMTKNVTINANDTSTMPYLENTRLRKHPFYIKFYTVATTSVVMVFAPIILLLLSIASFYKLIPSGNQRNNLLRMLFIITIMFVMCHTPKVRISKIKIRIKTVLEIVFISEKQSST